MQDGGVLNVTNPVYMRKDPGDDEDEDDEEEPLGASLIYTGNSVSLICFVLCRGQFLQTSVTSFFFVSTSLGCSAFTCL